MKSSRVFSRSPGGEEEGREGRTNKDGVENVCARAFHPREKKREQEKHKRKVESEIVKLYPNGEVMVINRTQLSDNNAERNVEKVRIQEEEVDQDRLEEDVEQRKDKEEEIIDY